MNFSIKDFFSKCNQTLNIKLRFVCSHKNVKYYNESLGQCPNHPKRLS